MMVQNQNYTNLRLKSPNSYANRKTSNEVNKQSKKLYIKIFICML